MGADASVTICADANGLAEGAAQLVVDAANEAAEARGRFMLCLAGGATPRATYERLARPPLSARMPWDRTWIFFGDERAVAPGADKARVLKRVRDERATRPATMVRPTDGELIWLVDRAAASLLQVGQAR